MTLKSGARFLLLCCLLLTLVGCAQLSATNTPQNEVTPEEITPTPNQQEETPENQDPEDELPEEEIPTGNQPEQEDPNDEPDPVPNQPGIEDLLSEDLTVLDIDGVTRNILIILNTSDDASGAQESIGGNPRHVLLPHLHEHTIAPRRQSALLPRITLPIKPRTHLQNAILPSPRLTHEDTTHTFKALNVNNSGGVLQINATLQYGDATSKCLIYVENGEENAYDWDTIGETFDTTIQTEVTEKYGEFVDIDENGKTIFLYYDMDSSVLGYFWNGNFFDSNFVPASNEMDIVFINSNIGSDELSISIETVAHEYTHLVMYSERTLRSIEETGNPLPEFETWIEEGLAELAADITYQGPLDIHFQTSRSSFSEIINGISLFNWENSALQYTLSYLFFDYLYLQSESSPEFTKDIVEHRFNNSSNIARSIQTHTPHLGTFEEALESAIIAKYTLAESGIYSYLTNNDKFNRPHALEPDEETLLLGPGGSVVFYPTDEEITEYEPSQAGSNIKHILLLPHD